MATLFQSLSVQAVTRVLSTLFCTLCLTVSISSTAHAQERVSLSDGSNLTVFVVLPQQQIEAPWPLVIVMGGGPGNMSISQDTARWLGGGFAERGWAVAVPVSPDNRSFRNSASAAKVELLITELQQRDNIRQGKVLLAGISNGGMSALEIASRQPQNYLGVVAVPMWPCGT